MTIDEVTESMPFELQVVEYKEHENGSATIELEMCDKAKSFLIEQGFISIIKKSLNEFEASLVE